MERVPAKKIIWDEIHNRLLQIKKENGYSIEVNRVERSHLEPFKASDFPAINYWPGTDQLVKKQGDKELREVSLTIEIYDRQSEVAMTDKADQLEAEVKTAIWRSSLFPKISDIPSQNLGGIVNSFSFDSTTPAIGKGQAPFCGCVISVAISYRVSESDATKLVI